MTTQNHIILSSFLQVLNRLGCVTGQQYEDVLNKARKCACVFVFDVSQQKKHRRTRIFVYLHEIMMGLFSVKNRGRPHTEFLAHKKRGGDLERNLLQF